MITGLGADFGVGVCCLGALALDCVACFPELFTCCVHKGCLLILESGMKGRVGCEGQKRMICGIQRRHDREE